MSTTQSRPSVFRSISCAQVSPYLANHRSYHLQDFQTAQRPSFVLQLERKIATLEARLAAQLEAQKAARDTPVPTPTVQQESSVPPPAPDPQTHELESMLPLLAQQMSNMAATFGPNSKPRENKLRTSPSDCKTTSPQIPVNPRSESSLNRTTTPKLHRHPPQVDSP
jgi:hypothetical protein